MDRVECVEGGGVVGEGVCVMYIYIYKHPCI